MALLEKVKNKTIKPRIIKIAILIFFFLTIKRLTNKEIGTIKYAPRGLAPLRVDSIRTYLELELMVSKGNMVLGPYPK